MPNWRKVATSGSAASFSSLHVSTSVTASIFSGSQFIGNLSGTASQATSASLAQTASFARTAQTASSITALNQNVVISGSLTLSGSIGDAVTEFTVIGDTILSGSTIISGSTQVTGSLRVSQGITGSLLGTSSYATQALSSSYALSASYAPSTPGFPFTGSAIISGSLTITGSLITTQGITGSLLGTASYASRALSSSYALTASYVANAVSASYALSSSYALSASYVTTAQTASYVETAQTASYVLQAVSASYALQALSSSYALTASHINPLVQDVQITGSLNVSGSTTQVGNNTLSGNTLLSGSIGIVGDSTLTGSFLVSGSTTQTGNNNLFGTTTLSGSITISGSLSPTIPTIKVYGSMDIDGHVRFNPVAEDIDSSISASYIYVSGSTQDLYFSQNSKGYANTTRLRWIEGNLYTGLLNGGLIITASSTVYQISSGSGIIVSLNASLNDNPYPTIQYLNWGNLSQSIAPLTASYQQAFVGIQSNGTIYQQGTPITAIQNDSLINIGNVLFQNQSTINGVKTQPYVAYGLPQRQDIFTTAFGPLKLSGYTLAPSGSSTGSLVVGSGTAYSDGANYSVNPNNPSYVTDDGTNISKIFRYYQSGSTWVYNTNGGLGYRAIDPSKYSNKGTLTTVQPNDWSIQRVFWYPNSVTKAIVVYYGNASYATEAEAASNIPYETFVEAPNTAANAIYLGSIVISGNGRFTNSAEYKILAGGLFRQVGGSGGGGSVVTQTLSGLSDVQISGQTDGQPLAWSDTAGHWINSPYISASVAGNATSATSASYAATSSWALNAINANTASYASQALSSSYALTASYVANAVSASYALSSSYALSASCAIAALTASYVETAQTASYVLQAVSASYALSSSYAATASYAEVFNIGGSQMMYSNKASTTAGNNGIFATNTGSFAGAFYQYTLYSGSNARSENATAVWTPTTSSYTNYSTIDVGDTSGVAGSIVITGGQIQLNLLTPTAGWSVRAVATFV